MKALSWAICTSDRVAFVSSYERSDAGNLHTYRAILRGEEYGYDKEVLSYKHQAWILYFHTCHIHIFSFPGNPTVVFREGGCHHRNRQCLSAYSRLLTVVCHTRNSYCGSLWKSHATLTLLAKQDLAPFGYNMIDPLKSWCWGSILFYPFKISRFS